MREFSVMLEGGDGSGRFFVTLEIAADNENDAVSAALEHAQHEGWSGLQVEEVSCIGETGNGGKTGIRKVYGKSYFEPDQN